MKVLVETRSMEQSDHNIADERVVREDLIRLTAALRANLRFHQDCGIKGYALAGGLRDLAQQPEVISPRQIRPEKKSDPAPIKSKKMQLLVIGDYNSEQMGEETESSFGKVEDEMLWNMMRAMQLKENEVSVRNAFQRDISPPGGLKRESLHAARVYIEEEIARMQPRVICVMGEVAAEVLCGENEPIHRLRRRQHRYKLGSKSVDTIPMQVTYHPRFLAQFPEFKKAAWQDLQTIMSLLAKK